MSVKTGQRLTKSHEKFCKDCGVPLKVGENWTESRRKYSQYTCNTCQAKKRREWYIKNPEKAEAHRKRRGPIVRKDRTDNLSAYLEPRGFKCELCGGKFHQNALDLHHIDPSKKTMAMSAVNWGGKRGPRPEVVEEADTCALLCSTCHRMEHLALREGWSILAMQYPQVEESLHWSMRIIKE